MTRIHLSLVFLCIGSGLPSSGESPSQVTRPADTAARLEKASIPALMDAMGDPEYLVREEAMRMIISHGQAVAEQLRARLQSETDLEIRHRINFALEAVLPPSQAVMLLRPSPIAARQFGLRPGDLITHINSSRVRTVDQIRKLRQRDGEFYSGSTVQSLRIVGADGPRELTDFPLATLQSIVDYVAPRGEQIAQVIRLYADGFAEEASARLLAIPKPIDESQLPASLAACIRLTGGDATAALEMLRNQTELVEAAGREALNGPSRLDLVGPFKAPLLLEAALWEQKSSSPAGNRPNDRDFAIQRVKVPANRYVEALVEAAATWDRELRPDIARPQMQASPTPGNLLAVSSWMLCWLGLRSECIRLIEPRSLLLGKTWVRVEIAGWPEFFDGRHADALDAVYAPCREVLQTEDDRLPSIIRNPEVAARVFFFLYQNPDDQRVKEAIEISCDQRTPAHAVVPEIARWMLAALHGRNAAPILRDLRILLSTCDPAHADLLSRWTAVVGYSTAASGGDALREAVESRKHAPSPATEDFALWDALVRAMGELSAGRTADAATLLQPYADRHEVRALLRTCAYRSAPPEKAAACGADAPLLATPIGRESSKWILVTPSGTLLLFDAASGKSTTIAPPTPTWFPGPLNWPWVGRDENTGRVWVYDRRRLAELNDDGSWGLRVNLDVEMIPLFEKWVAPVFSDFAALVDAHPVTSGENGEFLRQELRANVEYTSDPDIPEIGSIRTISNKGRFAQCGLRGGPSLLIDGMARKSWSSDWLAAQAGAQSPLTFVAQAPREPSSKLALISNRGLIWFDPDALTATRLALPGNEPFPPLVPESTPYDRADPRWIYFARTLDDGGQVFRIVMANEAVERVDLTNISLPADYYSMLTRAQLREMIDRNLLQAGAAPLNTIIESARREVLKAEQVP